jgi:hypothetical protein
MNKKAVKIFDQDTRKRANLSLDFVRAKIAHLKIGLDSNISLIGVKVKQQILRDAIHGLKQVDAELAIYAESKTAAAKKPGFIPSHVITEALDNLIANSADRNAAGEPGTRQAI